MRLNVVIPTYNRHIMLKRTLDSLLAAEVPASLAVDVTVVDNNSIDATRETVENYIPKFGGRLHYVFESRQGRSFALNAGITSSDSDLIGMIDDDEEVDVNWYSAIYTAFSTGDLDFAGGPYVPRWGADVPAWLPTGYLGAIGWVDGGNEIVVFDDGYPGMLMGGNAVLTREILNRVGLYNTNLGRTNKGLISGEDDDMYRRLLEAGARGLYLPHMIIYHYIPAERLVKSYFRRWCFWRGVSSGLIDRERHMPVVYLAGVPRFIYGQLTRGVLATLKGLLSRSRPAAQTFNDELSVWDAVGFFYGKHFYRARQVAGTPKPSRVNEENS